MEQVAQLSKPWTDRTGTQCAIVAYDGVPYVCVAPSGANEWTKRELFQPVEGMEPLFETTVNPDAEAHVQELLEQVAGLEHDLAAQKEAAAAQIATLQDGAEESRMAFAEALSTVERERDEAREFAQAIADKLLGLQAGAAAEGKDEEGPPPKKGKGK